ncbi:MAG: Gfo/Idh/MocA family protein, partial [Stellaceae bacterium]
VSVVSRRGVGGGRPVFQSLGGALDAGSFDHVAVAVETAGHQAVLTELAARNHTGFVLVEKPLFAAPAALPQHGFRRAGVNYNLRFHPAVRTLRTALAGRPAEIADFHVGQWLGDWRPGRDTAATYSASRAAGGGVLRDLSHELDLAAWLFGPVRLVAALGGRLGTVTVDADDGWGLVMSCQRCPVVTVHLNSLDRRGRRHVTIQVEGETLAADLVKGTVEIGQRSERIAVDRDSTIAAMHQALIDGAPQVCSLEDGARVVALIAAIEQSARERKFIEAPA